MKKNNIEDLPEEIFSYQKMAYMKGYSITEFMAIVVNACFEKYGKLSLTNDEIVFLMKEMSEEMEDKNFE